MKRVVSLCLAAFLFSGGNVMAEDLRKMVMNEGLKAIPADKEERNKVIGNPDKKLIELGKKLYFDPRLSKSGLISCNTCHNLATGGADGVPAAIGHKWVANPHHLNSPTVYNSVFNASQMWDGRFANLEEQAKGPIQAPPEMDAAPELVVKRLNSIPAYVEEFKRAYAKDKNPVTFDNVAKAIAAFERTLVTPSRFDAFMNGNGNALTKGEKAGLKIFVDKGCATCHGGMGFGGGSLQPFPVVGKYKYDHLGDFKGNKNGLVKVPLLRNITNTAPYFHNGAVWTLEEAVKLMGELQLGMELSNEEINKIVDFLKALEGVRPEISYPVLPASTAHTPKPDIM